MSAGLAASTVTPGSTAPLVSRTTPAMLLWANVTPGIRTRTANAATLAHANCLVFMVSSLSTVGSHLADEKQTTSCAGLCALVMHAGHCGISAKYRPPVWRYQGVTRHYSVASIRCAWRTTSTAFSDSPGFLRA